MPASSHHSTLEYPTIMFRLPATGSASSLLYRLAGITSDQVEHLHQCLRQGVDEEIVRLISFGPDAAQGLKTLQGGVECLGAVSMS